MVPTLIAALIALTPPSLSIGNASEGRLVNGVRMPARGPHHRVLKPPRRRGYDHGTQELVGALQRAAATVAKKHEGSVTIIGNLSRKKGGDIGPSVSHNSGRDADVAFFATDRRGRPVVLKRFRRFDRRLRGKGGLRFDVARSWTFVEALLSDERIQIQWMFCASWLREALIEHATKRGAPTTLIAKASDVLGQPANSSPHAEHFHIRLYCAKHERLQGCLNYGPVHAWADDFADEVRARTAELVTELSDPDAAKATAAAELIGAIRGHSGLDALITAVRDPRPSVRAAAATSIVSLRDRQKATEALTAALEAAHERGDRAWVHQLVWTLGRLADPQGGDALGKVLDDRARYRLRTRVLAAKGLSRVVHPGAVGPLIRAVGSGEAELRDAALEALRYVTNHDFGAGKRGARRWRYWHRKYGTKDRIAWVRRGFQKRHKIRFSKANQALEKLVDLVKEGGATGYNARAMIEALTGHRIDPGHFSAWHLWRFYRAWLEKRSGRP